MHKISKISSMSMVLCAMEKDKTGERIRKFHEVAILGCKRRKENESGMFSLLRALSRSCTQHLKPIPQSFLPQLHLAAREDGERRHNSEKPQAQPLWGSRVPFLMM